MKSIKIECTPNEAGQCTNTKTIVSNADTGMPLGGVQKAVITFDVKEVNPKVELDVINLNRNFNATTDKINLNVVMFGDRYTYESELISLSKEQLIEIIKYEAKLRYLAEHECVSESYYLRNKDDKEYIKILSKLQELMSNLIDSHGNNVSNIGNLLKYNKKLLQDQCIVLSEFNNEFEKIFNNAIENLIHEGKIAYSDERILLKVEEK